MGDVEDVMAQAEYELRSTGIVFAYGRYNGLGEREARAAVTALAAAGLLKDCAPPPAASGPLSLVQARARLDRQLRGRDMGVEVATAGTLRLLFMGALGYRTVSHHGQHYSGSDLADAVDAYNEVLAGA